MMIKLAHMTAWLKGTGISCLQGGSTIHWINHQLLYNSISFDSAYLLDSNDLTIGWQYPTFEKLQQCLDGLINVVSKY